MKILSIIPARGGSKGIPHKNIQKLSGKPLLVRSIECAQNSRLVNRIIVSTDDKKIAKIAKNFGAEVPFIRPKKFAKDSSPTLDVIKHALTYLYNNESYEPHIVTILQPTNPFCSSKIINKSISLLKKTHASSVLTVTKIKKHPYSSFWYRNEYLTPFRKNFTKYYQRQKYPNLYYPTGDVYTFWNDTLLKYGNIYGSKIKPLIINEETVDVDNIFDLFICEMKKLYWQKYIKKFKYRK